VGTVDGNASDVVAGARKKTELDHRKAGRKKGIVLVSVREPSQSVPENGDVEVD
jgi:hypothetical protein